MVWITGKEERCGERENHIDIPIFCFSAYYIVLGLYPRCIFHFLICCYVSIYLSVYRLIAFGFGNPS
jgi:hypothetical protein